MDRFRVARGVMAAGAVSYFLAVLFLSRNPGPRAWALHVPGFLPPTPRFFVMAPLFLGALLLVLDFTRARASFAPEAPRRVKPRTRRESQAARAGRRDTPPRERGPALPGWVPWLLLLPLAWIFWRFEIRTRFLGDSTVWLAGIISRNPNPYSEPLAAALWKGFALSLRALGLPIDAVTAGLLPILCGLTAMPILWGIASELTRQGGSRPIAFALLATLGVVQLYFGYIESYPPVSVAMLAYLWLGLRRARDADHPVWLGLVLAISIGFHLASVFLAPSYLYLLVRDKRPLLLRGALSLLPFAGAAGLLILLGYPPSRWVGAFRLAARAVESGQGPALQAKPYAALSLDHAWDLFNAVLLILPVPALLLAAAMGSGTIRGWRRDPATLFLAIAALGGMLLALALVLPVAPAQDWDLTAILLLPLAVLGVKAGCSIPGAPLRGLRGWAVALLGTGALSSFVLVNASEESGLRRYETVVGPGSKITPYARAYGNEVLATYDASKRDFARALVHAQRALDAEPTNPRYWIKKGASLYELGRFREAIPVLREGVRRGPARDDAYYNLGNALMQVHEYDEALANFHEAIRRSKPRPDYFNNLAVALYYSGRVDTARVVWVTVARGWPSYSLARKSLVKHFGPGVLDSIGVSETPP